MATPLGQSMRPTRVAWITGGGTGIGRALCVQLCRQGYSVLISGRRQEFLTQTARDIDEEQGAGRILALAGDVRNAEFVKHAAQIVGQRYGNIDLLINNAGVNTFHTLQDTPPDEFVESFTINCLSAILCTKAVLPDMLLRRSGTVVNVSSFAGKWASAKSSAYSVSKYALTGFTDSIRQELHGSGVHVMGVYPGFVRTPMLKDRMAPHSVLERISTSPESMAAAILRGMKRKTRDVYHPFYVPILLKCHDWLPGAMESLLRHFKV